MNLQAAELKFPGVTESGAKKPVMTEQQRSDQIDLLTQRMDGLTKQFQAFLDLQSGLKMGGVGLLASPIVSMPSTSGVVTSLPALPVVTTTVTATCASTNVV